MPTLDEARAQVALANRILAHEGVLDAFGHVSVRHPSDPSRYLLARSRSPELIEPADVLEFTLELAAGGADQRGALRRTRDPWRDLPQPT